MSDQLWLSRLGIRGAAAEAAPTGDSAGTGVPRREWWWRRRREEVGKEEEEGEEEKEEEEEEEEEKKPKEEEEAKEEEKLQRAPRERVSRERGRGRGEAGRPGGRRRLRRGSSADSVPLSAGIQASGFPGALLPLTHFKESPPFHLRASNSDQSSSHLPGFGGSCLCDPRTN